MPTRKPIPPTQTKRERRLFAAITRTGTMFVVGILLLIYEASPLHRGEPRPVLVGVYALMMGLTPILQAASIIRRNGLEEDEV